MKEILVTAGPVYGNLDDNKLISNRSRGLWATGFAKFLAAVGHKVHLLVPDIMIRQFIDELDRGNLNVGDRINMVAHTGYDAYARYCEMAAGDIDAMIMAAAVLNYIPETPYPGKMPTDKERILIPFIRAPHVIDKMKQINPKLTLIGCKLLFSDDLDKLIEAAYHVVLNAKCNAVVANDAKLGLRRKFVVHQDKTVVEYNDDFKGLYEHLAAVIDDVHYCTDSSETGQSLPENLIEGSEALFDRIVDKWRHKFVHRQKGKPFVFGSVAVRRHKVHPEYLVSPREKGKSFNSESAVVVLHVEDRLVKTYGGKATLNAPLLVRHLEAYPQAAGVVHFHGDWKPAKIPTVVGVYAPPGTARDNERKIPGPTYKIQGHGWIIAVDEDGNPINA